MSRSQNRQHLISLHKNIQQNQTYLTQSLNSNFLNYKDGRVAQRMQDEIIQSASPFNFSSDGTNDLHHEEPKTQSIITSYAGGMKMDKFMQKPSSTTSYTVSPHNKHRMNIIQMSLNNQNSHSHKTINLQQSPRSLSPTTKKSNLSTHEDNNLELQIKHIGQSLTERLHQINNDKQVLFGQGNPNTSIALQNILLVLKAKDNQCECKPIKGSYLSSRKQSRQQYGIQSSTIVTP